MRPAVGQPPAQFYSSPGPAGSCTHPPQYYGCTRVAFLGVYSPRCLGCGLISLLSVHSPLCLDVGSVPPLTPAGVPGSQVERRLELVLQNSSNCPRVSLFFPLFLLEKILLLKSATPYKEGPVLSHSPSLQLDPVLSRSEPHTAQLSTHPSRHTQSPWVYHFILMSLPVTSSNQVSLAAAQTLFGRGGSG